MLERTVPLSFYFSAGSGASSMTMVGSRSTSSGSPFPTWKVCRGCVSPPAPLCARARRCGMCPYLVALDALLVGLGVPEVLALRDGRLDDAEVLEEPVEGEVAHAKRERDGPPPAVVEAVLVLAVDADLLELRVVAREEPEDGQWDADDGPDGRPDVRRPDDVCRPDDVELA